MLYGATIKLITSVILMRDQDHHLFTFRRLASRRGYCTKTIKRRKRPGILPALKLGRGVRYYIEDLKRIKAEAVVTR